MAWIRVVSFLHVATGISAIEQILKEQSGDATCNFDVDGSLSFIQRVAKNLSSSSRVRQAHERRKVHRKDALGWLCPEFNGQEMLEKNGFTHLRRQFGGRDSMLNGHLTVIPGWKSVYVQNRKAANSALQEALLHANITGSPRAYRIDHSAFNGTARHFFQNYDTKAFTFVRDPTTLARTGFAEIMSALHEKPKKPHRALRQQQLGLEDEEKHLLTTLRASAAKWSFLDVDLHAQPQLAFELYLQDLARLKRTGKLGHMLELPANSHVVPQWTRMLYEDGPDHRIAMDFVGKIENLSSDFESAQAELDVPKEARVRWPNIVLNEGLHSLLPLKAALHTVNLTAQANRSIAEAFEEDFRCLGYPLPE